MILRILATLVVVSLIWVGIVTPDVWLKWVLSLLAGGLLVVAFLDRVKK